MQDAFATEYGKLNAAQKQAVDAIEGPVMVIAGPGTGKTQILTLRIANILLRTDTQPEQILALTFTDAAAQNMRRRLAQLIGNRAYRVVINTFHGFCNDSIKRYPEDFPRIIGSRPITDIDQVAIVESIIDAGDWVLLKPWGDKYLYVRDIVSAISDLKREGVSPDDFKKLVAQEQDDFKHITDLYHEKGAHKGKMKGEYQKLERKILKNEELARMYEAYQEKLAAEKQYDFNDMILEVLQALSLSQREMQFSQAGSSRARPHSKPASPAASLLQMLQEEYQYVLVDEHQDTNNAQNKILELLMSYHENPNLFIVGDEKQAIFRFQGASLENFHYFKTKYPGVQLITLTENYRSTQSILDTAGKLLESGKLQKKSSVKEAPIRLGIFSSESVERYFVVHDIRQKIDAGVEPHEITILYRNNKDAFPIARDLDRLGVPYQIESDQDLFNHPDVRTILTILRAIAHFGDNEYVTELLHAPLFQIDPLDAYKVLRSAADKRKNTVYDMITDEDLLKEIHLHDKKSISSLGGKMKAWTKESRKKDIVQLFEHIMRDSGLLEGILGSPDAHERFSAINAFFDELKKFADRMPEGTLLEFFTYLETVKKHKLFLKRTVHASSVGRVRLMTVHKSKGQEFAHVYIIRVIDGVFGGKIDRDRLPLLEKVYSLAGASHQGEGSDDERRLFYVALTRAKASVTITHARVADDGRETLPSQFIQEIQSELITGIHADEWEEKYKTDPGFQYTAVSSELQVVSDEKKSKEEMQKYVHELFEKQGLSPTALNNYLECPWKYFYQNLIRVPTAQTIHQRYGIAIHGALQDFFRRINDEETGMDFLIDSYTGHLNHLSMAEKERDELLKKGTKALSGWYKTYQGTWCTTVMTEFRINGIMLGDGTKLTGVLDKLEFVDGGIVNVVDYKTGKPKTRNDLMGKTKSGDGNYYRQLVFYKLLLNHFDEGTYSMQSGVIDFIEPDEKGKFHKEAFAIADQDVAELEALIQSIARDIASLAFMEKGCGEKDCDYCTFAQTVFPALFRQ